MAYLIFLLILPTGNTNPALVEADRLLTPTAVLPLLAVLASFPLSVFLGASTAERPTLDVEALTARGAATELPPNGLEIPFDLLAALTTPVECEPANKDTAPEGKTGGTGGKATGAVVGALLSNKVSGTRATVKAMDELVQASLPLLSRVSRMVIVGNRVNILSLNPGSLDTGLLIKSSCSSCLSPRSYSSYSIFSILFAPSMRVCRCLEPLMADRDSPVISLNTRSSLMSPGRWGKLARDLMLQSLRVSICRQGYRSISALISGVKQPPKRTETMSSTKTMLGGCPSVWSRMASMSLAASGELGMGANIYEVQ